MFIESINSKAPVDRDIMCWKSSYYFGGKKKSPKKFLGFGVGSKE